MKLLPPGSEDARMLQSALKAKMAPDDTVMVIARLAVAVAVLRVRGAQLRCRSRSTTPWR